MEPVPGSYRGVTNRFREAPQEIQDYFGPIPELINDYDWEASLAYMFARVEKALNRMLYCGAVKCHRANPQVALQAVDRHHMTRKEFRRLFKNVFGRAVPRELVETLAEAEAVRDKVIHGKQVRDADYRKVIVRVIKG